MNEIPEDVRVLLDELYQRLQQNWWEMPNGLLGNRAPCEVYAEDPERVCGVLHGLAEGVVF